ncbi:tetratricopeptide repeat protein [Glycomyces harbinensis]|uniref:Tetratricopeptide repeat-containing protein n=1 Tax=Glycomyces harbinensis TaxID=58114 RepID=A0A1G6XCX5_9ACTN|nr:tetratricopeptide repeat protein [Glycomyces harbinensis]SDD76084.1 Tetratricopeptide repeat-containing protein [Glycomyces harbinensis]
MSLIFEVIGLISDLMGLEFRERLPRLRVRRAIRRAARRAVHQAVRTTGAASGFGIVLRERLADLREDEVIDDYGNLVLRDSLALRLGLIDPVTADGVDHAALVRELRRALLAEIGRQGGSGGVLQNLHARIRDARQAYLGPAEHLEVDFSDTVFALPASNEQVIGRDDELAALLDHCRTAGGATIVWIHGDTGSGKTTLAVELARRLDERNGLAVPFVRMRGSSRELGGGVFRDTDAYLALADLLRRYDILSADRMAEPELRARWKSVVRHRNVQAVVLDDVLDIAQVEPFLPGDGHCVVIVSSRVAPPGLLARSLAIPALPAEAVLRHLAGLEADDGNQIGGLIRSISAAPLAMPLIRLLSGRPRAAINGLLEKVQDVDLIAAAHRFAVERLDADLRRSLGLLAAQPGFRLTAEVLAALDGTETATAASRLHTLSELGLLKVGADGAYGFHDRTYLHIEAELDEFVSAADGEAARLRLLLHQLDRARAVSAHFDDAQGRRSRIRPANLRFSAAEAQRWLTLERRNLVDALNYHREHRETGTTVVLTDICLLVGPSLLRIGYTRDAEVFLRAAAELATELDDRLAEAEARRALGGRVLRMADRYADAEKELRRAIELYVALGDAEGEAGARNGLGHIARLREDWDAAVRQLQSAREGYVELGLDRGEAECLLGLAEVAMLRDERDLDLAFTHYRDAGRLFQDRNDLHGLAESCWGRGEVSRLRGALPEAARFYETALDLARQTHDQLVEGETRRGLGELAVAEGQLTEALAHFDAAVGLHQRIMDQVGTADALARRGETLLALGRHDEARSALDEAGKLYAGIGHSHAERMRQLLAEHGSRENAEGPVKRRRGMRKDGGGGGNGNGR